jgi:cytochrome c biogenesis protein CcmG/thiol:disulfide interchange protein DsbE
MNWKAILWGAAAVGVIALLAFGMSRDPAFVPSPLIDNPAPRFELETLDRDTVRLADHLGDVVMVNFWASWCLACIDEHPLLVRTERLYEDQGVHVIGVVYQDGRDNARRWMEQRGGGWVNGLDRGSRAAIEYGVRGVPETFFIARDGRVVYRQIGPVTPDVLATLLPALIADSALTLSPEERTGTSEGWVQQGAPEER